MTWLATGTRATEEGEKAGRAGKAAGREIFWEHIYRVSKPDNSGVLGKAPSWKKSYILYVAWLYICKHLLRMMQWRN